MDMNHEDISNKKEIKNINLNTLTKHSQLMDENRRLKQTINVQNKKHARLKFNAKVLRTIVLAEAAALVLSVGIPNVQAAMHRKQGREAIARELEDQNMLPHNMDWDENERATTIKVDGEDLNVSSLGDYLKTLMNEALEDGATPAEIAVGFKNADVPSDVIKTVTGCDAKTIRTTEMAAYYELELSNQKDVGGISK